VGNEGTAVPDDALLHLRKEKEGKEQFTFHLPHRVREELTNSASLQERSLSGEILYRIRRSLDRDKKELIEHGEYGKD